MRRMTEEEARWLKDFDRSYNSHRCKQKRYLQDTMNQTWVTSIEEEVTDLFTLVDTQPVNEPKPLIKQGLKPSKRGIGPRNPAYSPRDYWALPSPWYSHGWVDYLIRNIDASKGEIEETDVPGIIVKEKKFHVFSFFNYERVSVGEYITLERAKEELKKYNKEKTQRGFGIDYDE